MWISYIALIKKSYFSEQGSEFPGERILMTKLDGPYEGRPTGAWQDDARLSMGNTTQDGRLDLKYKGKWRAVCTNYKKWVVFATWFVSFIELSEQGWFVDTMRL